MNASTQKALIRVNSHLRPVPNGAMIAVETTTPGPSICLLHGYMRPVNFNLIEPRTSKHGTESITVIWGVDSRVKQPCRLDVRVAGLAVTRHATSRRGNRLARGRGEVDVPGLDRGVPPRRGLLPLQPADHK